MSVSLTGNSIIQIGSRGGVLRQFADFADGDVGVLDFPNNVVEGKVGKNSNVIFSFNATGKTATLTLRLIRGSADDKYLNSQLADYLADPAGYVLMDGEIVQRSGDGAGNVTNDVYKISAGIVQKFPQVRENVEGDTEASVAIWTLFFANNDRSLT